MGGGFGECVRGVWHVYAVAENREPLIVRILFHILVRDVRNIKEEMHFLREAHLEFLNVSFIFTRAFWKRMIFDTWVKFQDFYGFPPFKKKKKHSARFRHHGTRDHDRHLVWFDGLQTVAISMNCDVNSPTYPIFLP